MAYLLYFIALCIVSHKTDMQNMRSELTYLK